jgi:hypothetical protein
MVGDYQSYVNKLKSVLAFFFLFLTVDVMSFRTRYFSESRKGHTPLHGRAYYQMMECLGVGFLFSQSYLKLMI